jgi:integrase
MVHRLLHKALGDAVRWGLIAANMAEQVEAPKPQTEEPELWSLEQVTEFIKAVGEEGSSQYSPLFGFLLASGCREGEALGLLWSDIDWKSGSVRIERQTTWVCNQPVTLPTKTRSGVRSLSIPDWGMALLHKQRRLVTEWRLRAGASWQGGDHVFTSNAGAVPSPSNLRRSLQALCSGLQLPVIRIHDLRHLHISILAMSGVPARMAQARAGHSSPMITMKVYSHVLAGADQLAAQAIQRMAGGI